MGSTRDRTEIPTQISLDGKRDGFARAICRKTFTDIVRSSGRARPHQRSPLFSISRHCARRHSDFPHKPTIVHEAARAGMPDDARRSMHSMKRISFGTDRASVNAINKTEET